MGIWDGSALVNKAVVAMLLLALVAGLAWKTMEPGRLRLVVLVILGSFVLRIVLASRSSR